MRDQTDNLTMDICNLCTSVFVCVFSGKCVCSMIDYLTLGESDSHAADHSFFTVKPLGPDSFFNLKVGKYAWSLFGKSGLLLHGTCIEKLQVGHLFFLLFSSHMSDLLF